MPIVHGLPLSWALGNEKSDNSWSVLLICSAVEGGQVVGCSMGGVGFAKKMMKCRILTIHDLRLQRTRVPERFRGLLSGIHGPGAQRALVRANWDAHGAFQRGLRRPR